MHSFGIHVARMAGMPPQLIDRANEILLQLEKKNEEEYEKGTAQLPDIAQKIKGIAMPKMQLNIFDAHSLTFEEIRNILDTVDINRLTPVEALLKLQEIKSKIK